MELFGKFFENADVEEVLALRPAPGSAAKDAAPSNAKTDLSKFSSSKSKATAKSGQVKYQFQVRLHCRKCVVLLCSLLEFRLGL